MDFLLIRGRNFSETFNFKNEQGKSISLPRGTFRLVLEHDEFAREYTINNGLTRTRTSVTWNISAEDTADFAFNVMYYTLYLDNEELARGILRIQ